MGLAEPFERPDTQTYYAGKVEGTEGLPPHVYSDGLVFARPPGAQQLTRIGTSSVL